ncbi:transcription termination factor NusA [candidate division WWE3 bacterium CG10_big_fil_rev_8_21_14_0_10_32_10]|uniref:Transcription termination/antitermination protein NusA n=1 Tax=candidate division WWE3 bacterium CG10_big_fil_rev_8_21_14_0_10_32_10 TaxID=1975090 RepID=A0A2H0R9V0_UNCKA|nr:MAG: transcription termination factor NusA [candidate division WWE3 bacterium CG10_big_fil_rev_8_21_14_0_10_32_10]
MITEFGAALNQVATERGISLESVIEAIESALVAAYRKDFAEGEDIDDSITSKVDPETGSARIYKDDKDITPAGFGRIAAQTAKQVILQQIRKTEVDSVIDEFRKKINSIVQGTVFRVDPNIAVLDLGRVHGVMPLREQIPGENYRSGMRLNVLVKDIRDAGRGTEIVVSRADKNFIVALFEMEVPEMVSGIVKIQSVAREAGSRTKMAVSSSEQNVDPVGACVGHKGVRVQSVLDELDGEKIDIIPYDKDVSKYIANSLSPAKVTNVKIHEETKEAEVKVPEDQQSLAIGKQGQNVRLAHKLTGWKIDIEGVEDILKVSKDIDVEEDAGDKRSGKKDKKKSSPSISVLNLDKKIEKSLKKSGINTVEDIKGLDRKELLNIEGIGSRSAEKILKVLSVH